VNEKSVKHVFVPKGQAIIARWFIGG